MKKICEICYGEGQISYFKGVSRFLLSTEDCPECTGLGYVLSSDHDAKTEEKAFDQKKKGKIKLHTME